MAKAPNYAIGIDLGGSTLKSVLIQRCGADRYVVNNYAVRTIQQPIESVEALSHELQALLKQMGGPRKNCGVAISGPDALIRIIEQPETPPELLREALRFNGLTLLNHDCRGLVLDCDKIESSELESVEPGVVPKKKYLVGGAPREDIARISDAFGKAGAIISALQIAPVCAFNAFEFSHPEIFQEKAFFLVDIGHSASMVIVGVKRELILVRHIDCGGNMLLETLGALSGESREAVIRALEQEDELMVENCRVALGNLAREIGSSIGFVEAQRDATVEKIYVCGGSAKSKTLLKVLSEEVRIPCESWNPLGKCEVGFTGEKASLFAQDSLDLHVACGAAMELLNAN